MKFRFLQDTGSFCAEFCAGRMIQMYRLDENVLLELRVEGRACAPTMVHVRKRTDDRASSYMQMAA